MIFLKANRFRRDAVAPSQRGTTSKSSTRLKWTVGVLAAAVVRADDGLRGRPIQHDDDQKRRSDGSDVVSPSLLAVRETLDPSKSKSKSGLTVTVEEKLKHLDQRVYQMAPNGKDRMCRVPDASFATEGGKDDEPIVIDAGRIDDVCPQGYVCNADAMDGKRYVSTSGDVLGECVDETLASVLQPKIDATHSESFYDAESNKDPDELPDDWDTFSQEERELHRLFNCLLNPRPGARVGRNGPCPPGQMCAMVPDSSLHPSRRRRKPNARRGTCVDVVDDPTEPPTGAPTGAPTSAPVTDPCQVTFGGMCATGDAQCITDFCSISGNGCCGGCTFDPGAANITMCKGSCNAAGSCPFVPSNSYIGPGSCAASGSCEGLVNGVNILAASCLGPSSCYYMRTNSAVGPNACTNSFSCNFSRFRGAVENSCQIIGACEETEFETPLNNSCIGSYSCKNPGAPVSIGVFSCTAANSCRDLGADCTIADKSCTFSNSCRGLRRGTSIMDESCNGPDACRGADSKSIGPNSCNHPKDPDTNGICEGISAIVPSGTMNDYT